MTLELLRIIKSFGFSAMFCSGLAGLAHAAFPQMFPGVEGPVSVMAAAALVGVAFQQFVNRYINNSVLSSFSKRAAYYRMLFELARLDDIEDLKGEVYRELTRRYFLGDKPGGKAPREFGEREFRGHDT